MMKLSNIIILMLGLSSMETLHASHHGWAITDAFTNDDGSLQYVQMSLTSANHNVGGFRISSFGQTYTFSSNVNIVTAGAKILLATSMFEATYSIKPDFTIPNGFLDSAASNVDYSFGTSILSWTSLPTDGITSQSGNPGTPTNNSGQTVTLSGMDDTDPVISNVPVGPLEIASNVDIPGTDQSVSDYLSPISCSDDTDSPPTLIIETPSLGLAEKPTCFKISRSFMSSPIYATLFFLI